MGPLHNIWVGMAAVGLDYFRSCTDLHHCLVYKPEVWLRFPLTGHRRFPSYQSTWSMQLKVKPNSSLAPPPQGLRPVPTPSLPLAVWEAAWSRMVPTSTLCNAALLHSLSQDAFLNSFFCQNSHLNLFLLLFFSTKVNSTDKHKLSFKAVYLGGF